MASVHRDPRSPRGVWYCSYTLADGRRAMRSTGERERAKAKIICEAWAETERAARLGSLSSTRAAEIINETLHRCGQKAVERIRLGDWFNEWLLGKRAGGISEGLYKRYSFALTTFLAFLGPDSSRRFMDSVTTEEISRFADYLKGQGRCASTVNRIVKADLGGAFGRATKLGKIPFNPVAGTDAQVDEVLAERKTFTPTQIAALVETARGTDWEGAVLFGYSSGARCQDVCNLRWSSIDLEAGVVVFRQRKLARKKPASQTIVGLHPDFRDWLMLRSASDDPEASVFPTLANRSGAGSTGLTNEFNDLVRRAGITPGLLREKEGEKGRSRRNLTFHALRHTAASSVFNSAAIREVARRVTGHAEGGCVNRYIHYDLQAVRAATLLIPRLPFTDNLNSPSE